MSRQRARLAGPDSAAWAAWAAAARQAPAGPSGAVAPVAERASAPASRAVRPAGLHSGRGARSAARASGRAWLPLFILSLGLVVLLYSMQLGSVTTTGYDLQRLQLERNEWRQRNEQLLLEMAKVQSLAWIEVEAVQRLGMRRADYVSYLEVAEPLVLATSEPAEPATDQARRDNRLPDLPGLWRGVLAQIMPPIEAGSPR